ncbi:NAD or nadp-dependent reductase, partial [Thalassiosira pseudonana CCMP1335]
GGHLTIYYGSQTGTAQMFAKQIASEAESHGFCSRVVDLQDVVENEDDAATRSKAIFFVATYGEGEPTDNAQQFWIDSISLDESATLDATLRDMYFLNDLDYCVFGLGNKQYEHYNNMGRFMDAALQKCGGSRIAPIGLGDDDDDLEGDFETWKDSVLWPALKERYVKEEDALAAAAVSAAATLPSCPYRVEYLTNGSAGQVASQDTIQTSSKHYSLSVDCPVVTRRELRDPSDPGSTVHMEIDISKHMDVMKYQTADNLGVLPKNDSSIVEAVASALKYDLDQRFTLQPNTQSDEAASTKHTLPFPTPCTVRECLTRYCDLSGPPRRSDLKQFAPYARDEIDRKALLRMSSKEGKAEYKEKIVEAHVGIADIVTKLCPSIVCPLEHFIMVCPRLQPRYYTISSSSTVHPKTIHITFAVLETAKKDGGKFKGLCSGHLEGVPKGDVVRVFVRDSTFRLPKQVERPVILIGPGTGIAPMRAILQERSHIRKTGGKEKHGANILYFGCKQRNLDYIYSDELESFQEEGTLSELHLAFSREQDHKVYVQHLLAKQSAETWRLIHDEKASIFVCGAVQMGADVDHTLQAIISEHGEMSREKAKAYLNKLALAGRFVNELWS